MADEQVDRVLVTIRQVEAVLEKVFGERLSKIEESDRRRIDIARSLEGENNFTAKDPSLALIRFIRDTWDGTKHNFLLFLRSLRAKNAQVQIFESELSANLLRELKRTETEFGSEDNFNKLVDLYLNMITFPEKDYIVGYIKTPPHRAELQNAINAIKNKKIADRIRETIMSLINEELDYLTKYLNEINSWKNREVITEDIQFFTSKISSFLYGRGEQYPGLFTYFKDEKLEQMVKSNPAYLQLTRYNLQLLYLRRLREKIRTYQTGDWTQFEEIYNNVKRIADTFVREFGNTEIATQLFVEKKEIREYPERWLRDIDDKTAEISSVQYRKTNVIYPFIKEMERIFNLRINELRSMVKPEVDELKDALKPLIKLERDSAGNIFKETTQYKKKLKARIRKLKQEFDVIENGCVDAMTDYMDAKSEIIDNFITREIGVRWKKINIYGKNESGHSNFVEKVIGDDPEGVVMDRRKLFAVLYSLEKAYQAGMGVSYSLRSIAEFFSRKDVLNQIKRLSDTLGVAEKAYGDMERFISLRLNFLIGLPQSQQERRT